MTNTNRVAVLVPAHTHVEPECLNGLHALPPDVYELRVLYRRSDLVATRNLLAHGALEAGFGALLWIDADTGFSLAAAEKLRASALPFVGAACAKKTWGQGMAVHWKPGVTRVTFGEGGGPIEVAGLGCGFTLVRREVYERIAETLPACRVDTEIARPFYLPMVSDGRTLSEDLSFCRRAQAAGFAVHADTSIRVWHIGPHAYGWESAFASRPVQTSLTVEIERGEG